MDGDSLSNSLGNTTGNYIILYSVIYILRNFCNILQYEIYTTRSILKQLTFSATRRAAPHHAACPDEFPMCPQRDAPHSTA